MIPLVSRRRGAAPLVVAMGLIVAVLAAEFGVAVPAAADTGADPGAVVSLVVTGDATIGPAQVDAATGGTGTITGTVREIGATVIDVPAGRSTSAARRLDALAGVRAVQRDHGVTAFDVTPNDPAWSYQDSMRAISAPAAWSASVGSPSVVIAIVDSGVNEVDDLSGRVLPGYDFVNGDADPADDDGHGTDSALVAAAAGNDAAGAAGLCWSCSILPVKVLGADGSGSMFDVASGIVWATNHGADIINLSLGGPTSDQSVTDALAYAYAHDVVVVASAGNDPKIERNYPAASAGVVAVTGNTVDTRTLYSWAKGDPTWVDVSAPGCNWVVDGLGLDRFCGTSSAAPVVAGIAGLLRSVRPSADRQMVATAIFTTADFAPTRDLVGYGIVDAGRAVAAIPTTPAGPTPLPADVTAPTVSWTSPSGYLSGTATVRVTAADDQAVAVDVILVDDRQVGYVNDPAAEQNVTFDTRTLSEGEHRVRAVARDRWGHEASTGDVTVTVDNVNPVGILTNPASGARVTGPFVARVFTTDANGIMGTFLIANDQVVGGYIGGGFGQAVVPVTKSGPIRVVALTVDKAGHIAGTNVAVVNAVVSRRRSRR